MQGPGFGWFSAVCYLYGRELYDHSDSPVPKDWAMEHENVAGRPAMSAQVAALSKTLRLFGPRLWTGTGNAMSSPSPIAELELRM